MQEAEAGRGMHAQKEGDARLWTAAGQHACISKPPHGWPKQHADQLDAAPERLPAGAPGGARAVCAPGDALQQQQRGHAGEHSCH